MNFTYNPEQLARQIMYYNPDARAVISGGINYPDIYGEALFYRLKNGVLVSASLENLPDTPDNFFAFHLHNGESCTGNAADNFADAGSHFNPGNQPHPAHAGDFPPLLSCNGSACLAFVTNRFSVEDIINKPVIIHLKPDDFTTQPSGNSGEKIACGIIRI